ncbi:hypothetical protein BH11PSE10_BH11PSE10_14130 [soil metagenome]
MLQGVAAAGFDQHLHALHIRHAGSATFPPLTDAQKTELQALAALPDSQIDNSELPSLSEAFWKSAVHNLFCSPVK